MALHSYKAGHHALVACMALLYGATLTKKVTNIPQRACFSSIKLCVATFRARHKRELFSFHFKETRKNTSRAPHFSCFILTEPTLGALVFSPLKSQILGFVCFNFCILGRCRASTSNTTFLICFISKLTGHAAPSIIRHSYPPYNSVLIRTFLITHSGKFQVR